MAAPAPKVQEQTEGSEQAYRTRTVDLVSAPGMPATVAIAVLSRHVGAAAAQSLPVRGLLLCSFCVIGTVTLASQTVSVHAKSIPSGIVEDWKPNLSQVQSVDQALAIMPAYIAHQRGTRDERITAGIDQFVRDRFFHGTSYLSARENWIAWLAGSVWSNLAIPVLPDDILKHRRAMCSQQAIVLMALLRHFKIGYGSVRFAWPGTDSPGHFATAAKVDGQWRYFDPDAEAKLRVPLSTVLNGQRLNEIYAQPELVSGIEHATADDDASFSQVDTYPAPRGGAFQSVTGWLSAYGWLILGLLWFLSRKNYQWLNSSTPEAEATSAVSFPARKRHARERICGTDN